MATPATNQAGDPPAALSAAAERPRLTFDLDVDICVIGGGLAGLTVAREAARGGSSVVVLEGRQVGWNASGHNLGAVMPGYGHGAPVNELIERVGFANTRELWALAQQGADYVRATAQAVPGLELTEGALEVSTVDAGERLIGRLQMLGEDFGTDVEGWQIERVREVLKTNRYFHAIHFPQAFQIDGGQYLHGLAALAERAGVRIFEDTPVVGIDPAGIRKRIVTPSARLRASHIVLAGNVHIGAPAQRLAGTLLPLWRYAALSAPLGEHLAEVIGFKGAVSDQNGIDHFRIVDGDRLMWSSPETTWQADPQKFGRAIRQRIKTIFPQLAGIAFEDIWAGAVGQTVHGMPQIGQLRPGLWVVSGFGRQGLNTTAMGGALIARSILQGDDRWRLFAPFELVWAGGTLGRVAAQAAGTLTRSQAAAAGLFARWRERAQLREHQRETLRVARAAAVRARSAEAVRRRAALARPRRDDRI